MNLTYRKMILDGELEPLRRELLQALVGIGPVAADTIASLMGALPPPAAPGHATCCSAWPFRRMCSAREFLAR